MSQALYRKWRPRQWEEVVGQEHVVQTLRNAVASSRVAHAYLFAGPRGTGKTTTARLLAKAVNCLHEDLAIRPCDQCEHCLAVQSGRFLDLIEIDAASNTSVEDVRSLRDKINFSPNQGRYKVYIIDEVHMLSTAAFNALLKTLEEPPPHAIFILATTEVHKIPATVLSRCQRHEFRRIPVADIVANLEKMAQGEQIQVEPEALKLIARQCTGAMRDAISLLDQLASTGQTITLELAQDLLGTAASQAVVDLAGALLQDDPAAGFNTIHRALDAGSDPRQFARQVVDYLRGLLLIKMGNADQIEATSELRAQMARHAQAFTLVELLEVLRLFNNAASDARSNWQPALPLELAFAASLNLRQTPAQPAPVVTPARVNRPAAVQVAENQPELEKALSEQRVPEGAGGGVTLQLVSDNWKQITQLLKQRNPNIEALLRSGKLLGVKDGILYLGYSQVLKTKIEKDENMQLIVQVFQQVLGMQVPIRCVVATGKGSQIPPDVESDGMVAAALRDLGGEIVDIQ